MMIPHLPRDFNKATLERALGCHRLSKYSDTSPVRVGSRHNALTSLVGRLRNEGIEDEALLAKLKERNRTFDPPLPENEVIDIAAWGERLEGGDGFVRNRKDVIIGDRPANIRRALDALGITLQYDAFAKRSLIEGLPDFGTSLSDDAIRRLRFHIEEVFGFLPPKDFFWEFVQDHARQTSFNPVSDELGRLQEQWDGKPRIDNWLCENAGAADSPFVRSAGAITLIAAARRARQPGVKFDTMLVLIGSQGCGKSTACKILAGDAERFSDFLPFSADGREVIEALSGHWIIEAGELAGMKKANADKLKSFLSRSVDHGRAAYGRLPQAVPRSCIFIGTTNSMAFLNDGTGNRRFWPIDVNSFDLDALARDRDQLIAEAAVREASGESITLPRELWSAAASEQDKRRVENPTVSALHAALGDAAGRIRSVDVWRILEIPPAQQHAMASIVANAMQELGWEGKNLRFGGRNPERGYAKGNVTERQRRLTVNFCGKLVLECPPLQSVA